MVTCPSGTPGASAGVPWSATPRRAVLSACLGRLVVGCAGSSRLADSRPLALGWLRSLRPPPLGRSKALAGDGRGRRVPRLAVPAGPHIRGPLPARLVGLLVPVGVLGLHGTARGPIRRLLILPLVLAMTYLTGHPQEWYLLVLALSVWTLADAFGVSWKGAAAGGRQVAHLGWSDGALARFGGRGRGPAVGGPTLVARRPRIRPRSRDPGPLSLAAGQCSPVAEPDRARAVRPIISAAITTGKPFSRSDSSPWSWLIVAIARQPNRRVVHGWLVLAGFAVWFACGRQLGLFTLYNRSCRE